MDRNTGTAHDSRNQPYALLTIEQRMLLLPQSEVRSLESVLDLHTGQPPMHGIGWLSFEHQDWPVYGMDAALNALSEVPSRQRICVLLALEHGYFGLLCSDVAMVQGAAVQLRPLPQAMAKPNIPLRALALTGDRVGLVSTAETLAVHFSVNLETLTTT